MKNITAELRGHLSQKTTTITTCYRIKRADGKVFNFCELDMDLKVEGELYMAVSCGFEGGVQSQNKAGDGYFSSILNSTLLDEEEIFGGEFDYAELEIFAVNHVVPDDGKLVVFSGYLGEVRLGDGKFSADLTAISGRFERQVGSLFSSLCRAEFGNSECGYLGGDVACNKEFKDCLAKNNAVNFRGEPHIPSMSKLT